MAIFTLAVPGNDIKLGTMTVMTTDKVPAHRDRHDCQNLGSGHDIGYFDTLDGRYKIPPTGWSE